METERRRFHRVAPRQPVHGAVGDTRIYLVDASPGGLQVVHLVPLPSSGAFCHVEIASDLGPLKLDCEIVRTVSEKNFFHSGLAIISADRQSNERMRRLFSDS